MSAERRVKLFRADGHQAVEIPDDLALPGTSANIRREGLRLVIEAVPAKPSIIALLDTWAPIDEPWPEIEDPVPAIDDDNF